MLLQPHFFTIEAWVRKDIDSTYEPWMTNSVGQVFHKINNANNEVMFGISMGDTLVRFHFMGSFYEYPHLIGTNDINWHFLAATYWREDLASTTTVYTWVDTTITS